MITPRSLNYRMPAEWEEQEAIWLAWPRNETTWPSMLKDVENSYIEMIRALHLEQKVKLLVGNEEQSVCAKLKIEGIDASKVEFYPINYVDSWIRDYGPTFIVNSKDSKKAIVKWNFNAWGDKYEDLKEDNGIPYEMNKILKMPIFEPNIVLEGGSIDVNGTGSLLTTEQCLLNKNRNPHLSKEGIKDYLSGYLNVTNILWLKEVIVGDDTDGHVDAIARFVSKNTVVCAFEHDKSDENYPILKENYELLCSMRDEDGKKLNVIKLPMPGLVGDREVRLPASYLNFYIGNQTVCVPVFGHKNDTKAIDILRKAFPERKVVGINCKAMVYGFGTLHCGSQQEPA